MRMTLKEHYDLRRLRKLNESTKHITRSMLNERKVRVRIVESFDQKKFKQAAAVLKKLQGIDFGSMSYFKQAVNHAISDVNDALGDGASLNSFETAFGKFIDAAKSKLSNAVRDPIPNALALSSALEQAFEQVTALIQHNFSNELSTGLKNKKIPEDRVLEQTPRKLVGDRANSLEVALVRAFAPEGILAKVGLTWKKQYLDPKQAAQTLMDAKFGEIVKAAKSFKQGPQTSDIAQELSADVGASSEQPTEKQSGDGNDAINKISNASGVAPGDVQKVIKTLSSHGLLKTKE